MKIPMTSRSLLLPVLLGVLAWVSPLRAADVEAVASPAKRQEALAQAKNLLGDKSTALSGKNPFNPEGFGETAPAENAPNQPAVNEATPAGPRTGKDLLQLVAASLKPKLVVLGGQPFLFFGQKRVKAGGLLTITFEGNEYALEVVAIDPPNFTLRLNREEFTRPIK